MVKKQNKLEPWIGMAEIKFLSNNKQFGRAKGAFVIGLALAKNIKSYDSALCRHLKKLGYYVRTVSDIESLAKKKVRGSVSRAILAKSKKLSKRNPVYLHTFHTFKK